MSKLKQLLFSLNETDRRVIEEKLKEKDQQIDQLKQQLAEKDKEIGKLQASCQQVKDYKHHAEFWQSAYKRCVDREKQSQTQLAIQELEKMKVNLKDSITMMGNEEHSYLQKVVIWYDICNQVNKQIKELKGGD